MQTYIRGISCISSQPTFNSEGFLNEIIETSSNYLHCIEPSYKDFLNPTLARRMARIVKMSMATSITALKDAGIEIPDAIITGTALGCLEDTEKFLLAITENDEQFLTPTAFIQSTHNTVGAQIALQLKCMNYNFTYVHKGFSFESAVTDALMQLKEGIAKNILIGAHDEMTEKYFKVCHRIGYWKTSATSTLALQHSTTSGSIAGEGTSFFVLTSDKNQSNYALLKGVKTFYKPKSIAIIENTIHTFLDQTGVKPNDIDIVIYGINGDSRFDPTYKHIKNNLFKNATAAYFKHLSGEYQTASGFALWAAAKAIKAQHIPKAMLLNNTTQPTSIKNILIYNSFLGADHSLFLLSQC